MAARLIQLQIGSVLDDCQYDLPARRSLTEVNRIGARRGNWQQRNEKTPSVLRGQRAAGAPVSRGELSSAFSV
jgi:hypothetical protein